MTDVKYSFAIPRSRYCDLLRNRLINIRRHSFDQWSCLNIDDLVIVHDGSNTMIAKVSAVSHNYYKLKTVSREEYNTALYGITSAKNLKRIVRNLDRIVSHFKTLAMHGLYGLTHTKSKNSIVKSKNSIVGHFKTLAMHGLYGLTHTKSKNSIVKSKNSIVSHFKTLAMHGLYGLTHTKSKNSIVKSKNSIVRSKNSIVRSKNSIVRSKNSIVSVVSYCFNNINNSLKNFKELK